MLSPTDRVLLEYAGLPPETTVNGELCPSCGGGVHKDRSLSVSRRDGKLLWICYRAGCGFRGAEQGAVVSARDRSSVPSARATTGRWIARESESLPEEILGELSERYGISPSLAGKAGFGWSPHDQRLVMPVRSPTGTELGVMLRALDGRTPKVISYTDKGAIAWYINHATPEVVIVEDQLSALRASVYSTSVALLGTDLSQSKLNEIKATAQGRVFLALDKDAIPKAVKYVVGYRSQLPMKLLLLDKDVKDMTHEQTDKLFSTIR